MKESEDHEYFECTLVSRNAKAIQVLLKRNGETHWVPESVCQYHHNSERCTGVLEVESWFAHREEMGE